MYAVSPNNFLDVVLLYPDCHSVIPGYGESMLPVIKDGDYLVVRWANHPHFDIDVGDIVIYIPPSDIFNLPDNELILICHRIVATNQEQNKYILKGFGNEQLDRWSVPMDNVIGKVITTIDRGDWISYTVSGRLVGNRYPAWINQRLAGN